jgi:CheY-like chemotaxis protein/nitrogen-specific signal transduction histidine kinase
MAKQLFPIKGSKWRVYRVNVVIQDLTDPRQLEGRLREADKRKDEFLAVLGHEWRNPLGVIGNAVELLPVLDTPEARQLRAIIKRQITRMTHLTNDLLDLSRISAGQVEIDKQSCDFAAIVREAAEDYRGILGSAGIRLALQLPQDPVWVLGDCRRLGQAVGNLLHNTQKFTPPGGTVTVTLAIVPNQQTAVLKVRDTGIGMDESKLTRLFEPFSQAVRSFDRSRGGLGLGLTLVKAFIEMHGGTVSASSKGPGKGSEFIVRLPVQRDPSAPSDAKPELSASQSTDPIACRVLIIDDNQVGARAMQLFLQDAGHLVEIAHNGVEAFVIARNLRPDVVLCDIALPWVDGYAIARTIRQDAELKNVYLIAISGYAQDEHQQLAKQAGFDEYCVKPVDLKSLDQMIKNYLCARPR